ncbi:metallophosphoesterase family protein [Pseudoduganella sp. UC29_106]|uniref:metallophosphoesterase family protein n=1 Tax=Pseudoduganella sp. UC29_106 TaxID=3374553 RepID=UPI0037564DF7
MRIAAISDIHGNLWALEAVLADIERRGVDMTVNLGDILSSPLQPRETAERLMPMDLPTISGNHERQVLEDDPARLSVEDKYAFDHITDEQRDWIRALPKTLRIADDVLLVHGTPGSDVRYFMETVTQEGRRAATHEEVLERAGDVQASLIMCGHTHIPRAFRLDDGRLIVNPGSVGWPAFDDTHPFYHKAENNTPHARYGIFERTPFGWAIEHHAVAYDWNGASEFAARNNNAEWAYLLRTGRMPR